MNAIKNKVQLIGFAGTPDIKTLEDGKKVATFKMSTEEKYRKTNGEVVKELYWHNIVAKGKLAEVVEKYVQEGKEIAIEGKLQNHEILATELLILGARTLIKSQL